MSSPADSRNLESLVVISGMSGSGKHTMFQAFEDLGYFCVDNIPPTLIPELVQIAVASGGQIRKIAVVVDVRLGESIHGFRDLYQKLQRAPYEAVIFFLDATDEILLRRYSETRRVHPLALDCTLPEGIRREREELSEIRELAHQVIDTSSLSAHDLKRFIHERFREGQGGDSLQVSLVSFGFKYGIPFNADLVFDVRFLPNPFFVTELRSLTGENRDVTDWVMACPETIETIGRISGFLVYCLPKFAREGKKYLTIAIGCTGGRHRSVVVAREIGKAIEETSGLPCRLINRDIFKES